MLDESSLQEIVRRIVAATHPTRILLFGSHGRGDADAGSDLDLMVIAPHVTDQYEAMVRLRQVIGAVSTGVDVLVYSEADYGRRSLVPGTVPYWARKEGRLLYEATP